MASVVFDGDGGPKTPVVEALRAAGIVLDEPQALRRTRFDTFDGRLHADGLRLEARTEEATGDTLVVTAADGPTARLLLPTPLDLSEPLSVTMLPPGPLRSRILASVGDRAVLPQLTLRTTRRSGTGVDVGGVPLVTVHLDSDLAITPPDAPLRDSDAALAAPTWTIEVEEFPGRRKPTRMLLRTLHDVLSSDGAEASEVVEGDALERAAIAAGVDRRGWQGLVRPDLDRHAAALVGLRAVLRSFADALDANWEGAADHLDDEFLHDLRIAVRQTRSLLAQGRRILPKDVRAEQLEAFRWLGDVTSTARDLDVYVAGWRELTALLDDDAPALDPVLAHLAGQRAVAHSETARALHSRTARQLRDHWRAWLDLPEHEVVGGKDAGKPLGRMIGARIVAAQEQLLTDGRRIDEDSPGSQLHELRKDGKRLRYLLEGFGHLGGKRRSKVAIRRLKDLQDNLGAHQDAEVQADRLDHAMDELAEAGEEHKAGDLPPEALAAGRRLAAALHDRQAAERAAFHDRFAAYDRKQARRTLEELVERMSR